MRKRVTLGFALPLQTLYDFFCGSGTMSLPLHGLFHSIKGIFSTMKEMTCDSYCLSPPRTGFDIDISTVEAANLNAQINNATNVTYAYADLTKPLSVSELPIKEEDAVIVNPPRAGLHPQFLSMLDKVC